MPLISQPWLVSLIERLRPDLCKLFSRNGKLDYKSFCAWLVTSGLREYHALLEDEEFLKYLDAVAPHSGLTNLQALVYAARPDVQAAYPLHAGVEQITGWFERHGIEEHGLWLLLSAAEQSRLLATEPWRSRYGNLQQPKVANFSDRPFGVNLIGYVYGQLGIGEDLRMAARALLAAGVPFTLIDFPPGNEIPQNDHSMAAYVSAEGPYAFNVFCLTALEHARFYAERGKSQLEGRYNIGYWPWELSRWPDVWKDLTRLVDEVWVSTRHTYDALAPVSPVPVFGMPMAVELGPVTVFNSRNQARQHFALPESAKLFCFSFDLNSSIHRKNPQACVDAFLQAFPSDKFGADAVGLVIKAHRPAKRHPVWEKLKRLAAGDGRIHIIERTLSRPNLLALYQCCDCFVSLHRAEGFGRGIAEALQLGLHVIATSYSGNVDFCRPPQTDLVRYRLVKVKKGQYPYGAGQVWAEADVAHAAELMRNFVACPVTKVPVPEGGWPKFSVAVVGQRYKERLVMIKNEKIQTRHCERAP